MLALFAHEADGIVYPLLAFPLVRVSDALAIIRLPSLVAGCLAIAALY